MKRFIDKGLLWVMAICCLMLSNGLLAQPCQYAVDDDAGGEITITSWQPNNDPATTQGYFLFTEGGAFVAYAETAADLSNGETFTVMPGNYVVFAVNYVTADFMPGGTPGTPFTDFSYGEIDAMANMTVGPPCISLTDGYLFTVCPNSALNLQTCNDGSTGPIVVKQVIPGSYNHETTNTQIYIAYDLAGNYVATSTDGVFTGLPDGTYNVYAVNYVNADITAAGIDFTTLSLSEVQDLDADSATGPCVDITTAFYEVIVDDCTAPTGCDELCDFVEGDVFVETTGFATNPAYTQAYILADNNNNILSTMSSPADVSAGETFAGVTAGYYFIYAVNYVTADFEVGGTPGMPLSNYTIAELMAFSQNTDDGLNPPCVNVTSQCIRVCEPITCDATATTISADVVDVCINETGAIVNVSTDGSEGDQELVYIITDETGTTILGTSDSPNINFGVTETTILDFESAATSSSFQAFGGSIEGAIYPPVANPDPSGLNTSANVIAFNKAVGAEVWSGGFSNPAPSTIIDLSAGGEICIKVWMDEARDVSIKLEASTTGGPNWILTQFNSVVNEWTEICFDTSLPSIEGPFLPATGHQYAQVVVFFNFLMPVDGGDEITYFDDITVQTPGAPPGTCLIYAVTHDGTLDMPTDQFADLAGCFATSNSIAINREDCEVEECGTVDAGTVADMTACDQAGGGNPTSATFTSTGDTGGTWSIDGGASISASGVVDATGLTPGTYTVTYSVDNPDLGDGTVCPDASTTATLTVEGCTPVGCDATATTISADVTDVCINEAGAIVNVSTDGSEGDQELVYIITDETGTTILGTSDSPTIDFGGSSTTILDFESAATSSSFQAFGGSIEGAIYPPVANPDPSGLNTSANVIAFNKAVGAEVWSGGFSNPAPSTIIDLSAGGEICIKVWMDEARDVSIKLEASTTGGPNWILTQFNSVVNEWTEICFDTSLPSIEGPFLPATGHQYAQVVVFFNFLMPVDGGDEITYFDDITVQTPGAPPGTCLIYAVTHDGTLDMPTDQFADLAGCFATSNSIAINREDCEVEECGTVDAGTVADLAACDQSGGTNPTSVTFTTTGDAGGTWTISGGASISSNGTVDATGLTPNTYTVTYTVINPDLGDGTVCPDASTTATLTVLDCTPPPTCGTVDAGTVANIVLCNDVFGDNPTNGQFTSDGDAGGTWTISGGASIDANGNVSAAGLAAGSYPVTYTVINPDLSDGTVCEDAMAMATLIVQNCPETCGTVNAGTIDDINLCNVIGGESPSMGQFTSLAGDLGGTWSITGGLTIGANGEVDATGATAGVYIVTYTVVNPDLGDGTVCDDDSASATLTVTECEVISCTNPSATFTTECQADGTFTVTVNISDIGNSPDVLIFDNQGMIPQVAGSPGAYTFSGYASGSSVQMTVAGSLLPDCFITSGELSETCTPPVPCDLELLVYFDCDQETGLTEISFEVNGTSATGLADITGSYNGTAPVDVGVGIVVGLFEDGDFWELNVSSNGELCDSESGIVDCALGTDCDYSIEIIDDCDTNTGLYIFGFIVNSDIYATAEVTGSFNGEVGIGELNIISLVDGDTWDLTVVNNNGEECANENGTVSCIKDGDCDLSIQVTEDCNGVTGISSVSFVVNGTSAETAEVSGAFNGTVDVGETIIIGDIPDGDSYTLIVSSEGEECDQVNNTVNCIKPGCDLTIEVTEDCNEVTGVSSVSFVVNGTSAETAEVSGAFNGTVDVGETIIIGDIPDGDSYTLIVSSEGEECDQVDNTVNCVKPGCDLTIEVTEDCNEVTGVSSVSFVVNGTSAETAEVSGAFNGTVDVGETIIIGDIPDGDSYTLIVSSEGEECDQVDNTVNCIKPGCDLTIVLTEECDQNTGVFTLGFTIESLTVDEADVSGTFEGTVNTNEFIAVGALANGDTYTFIVSSNNTECTTISGTVDCIKGEECETPIAIEAVAECTDDNDGTYNVTFTVTGGTGAYSITGAFEGSAIDGEPITFGPILVDESYTLVATDDDPEQICDPAVFDGGIDEACFSPGSIGDTVWCDTNGDGIQDEGEEGIGGIIITLTLPDGSEITTTTDDNGNYIFEGLADGDYTVTISGIPDDKALTTAGSIDVSLGVGENYEDADFGLTPICVEEIGILHTYFCDENGTTSYYVEFTVSGGSGTYNISGDYEGTVTAGTYTTDLIASGTNYQIVVEDADPESVCEANAAIGVDGEPCEVDCQDFDISVVEASCNLDGSYTIELLVTGGTGNYSVTGTVNEDDLEADETYTFGPFENGSEFTIIATDAFHADCQADFAQAFECPEPECLPFAEIFISCPEPDSGDTNYTIMYDVNEELVFFPLTVTGDVETTIESVDDLPFFAIYDVGSEYSVTIVDAAGCDTTITGLEECIPPTAIELLDFDGEVQEHANHLFWTTATEIDNDYFTLQRSFDGVSFEPIATIDGAGNSNYPIGYSYMDEDYRTGNHYYRLLATDFNGETNIASQVIVLNRESSIMDVTVMPVPAIDNLNINFTSTVEDYITLQVYNVEGKIVEAIKLKAENGLNTYGLPIDAYVPGTYMLLLQSGDDVLTAKFIKD